LDWNVDALGVYSIHLDDAVELFSELLEVPVVKDATWVGVRQFWRHVPGPLALCRAWLLVRAQMREIHWSPTTSSGFAGRLVALKAEVPNDQQDGFVLLGSDFIPLHDSFNSTVELMWSALLRWLFYSGSQGWFGKGTVWQTVRAAFVRGSCS